MRSGYQGTWNVVRFNWPKYAAGLAFVLLAVALTGSTTGWIRWLSTVAAVAGGFALILPLVASYMVYDRSDLYDLPWLGHLPSEWNGVVLNISAGFDESSATIRQRWPLAQSHPLDLYDPDRDTERSIVRARKAQHGPQAPSIANGILPFETGSVDIVHVFMSLHEVRKHHDRVRFLAEMRRTLKPDGAIMITEHLRDMANFLAYNFGAFHFHARSTWIQACDQAGLAVIEERPTTPFVTTFILKAR